MNRYYNLPDVTAAWLAKEKPRELVIVTVIEQPPEGYIYDGIIEEILPFRRRLVNFYSSKSNWQTKLPYPIGSPVWLRETWKRCQLKNKYGCYIYKVDNHCIGCKWIGCDRYNKWRSPATMPDKFIRYTDFTVTEARVCRVQNIGIIDIMNAGFPATVYQTLTGQGILTEPILRFKDWFNRRYSRTVKKWTWEQDPWVEVAVIERSKP